MIEEPQVLPSINIPPVQDLPRPTLTIPTADIPTFTPMVVPPSDLRPPPGVKKAATKESQPATRKLDIPVLDIQMPLPSPEVLVTAVTTAVVAVATTSVTSSLFEPIKKKVQKFIQGKIDVWKKKRKARNQASLKNLNTE
ncbi:hypothetical protein CYYG_00024 [Cyanophage SS120-1]|uniref:Uncharacterized protein n=1 Tax=Cyanophage SS120-1 TaxID=616674 RepID=M1T356_9CAUD|nr:hypothetical protein CYYG_00024 [Cyanophage SS120-1]AGG54525.1 hypothetical protein CYYG_00024 [Cyanophage SS120-1]